MAIIRNKKITYEENHKASEGETQNLNLCFIGSDLVKCVRSHD